MGKRYCILTATFTVNAAELVCKLNPDNQHHISEHRLIVRRCGKGESKGYKAVIVDYAVIRRSHIPTESAASYMCGGRCHVTLTVT